MRKLAIYDYKDYIENGTVGRRPSVRGIIIQEGKIALVHSRKYDHYTFPGGGIDEGESHMDTLIREVAEETGLIVIPASVKEYGLVVRKEKGMIEDLFIQENFYYFCEVEKDIVSQKLDDHEAEEEYVLEWVEPKNAIETNLKHDHKDNSMVMRHLMERESRLLEMLMEEGKFGDQISP